MSRSSSSCTSKICWCACILLVIILASVLSWYFLAFQQDESGAVSATTAATCNGCYCIPQSTDTTEDGSSEVCPTTMTTMTNTDTTTATSDAPIVSVPVSTIEIWQSTLAINPYTLDCNPFDQSDDGDTESNSSSPTTNAVLGSCQTTPPLDPTLVGLGNTAVCAIHYEKSDTTTTTAAAGESGSSPNVAFNRDTSNNNSNNNSTIDISSETSTSTSSSSCPSSSSYYLVTYPSVEAANEAGGHITHVGACGVCSTLQDLAVLANIDNLGVTSPGSFCRQRTEDASSSQSSSSKLFENGVACYTGLGLTQDCARLWADASWYTAQQCFAKCVLDPTIPGPFSSDGVDGVNVGKWFGFDGTDDDEGLDVNSNSTQDQQQQQQQYFRINSSDDQCIPNECVQCEDRYTASIFQQYAGRTRIRSGLLSTTIRGCNDFPPSSVVSHSDPCPSTMPFLSSP